VWLYVQCLDVNVPKIYFQGLSFLDRSNMLTDSSKEESLPLSDLDLDLLVDTAGEITLFGSGQCLQGFRC